MQKLTINSKTPLKARIAQVGELRQCECTWMRPGDYAVASLPLAIERSHIFVEFNDRKNGLINRSKGYLFVGHTDYVEPNTTSDDVRGEIDGYRMSKAGLALLKSFEGCELNAYFCSSNVCTIGYGHTKGVTPQQKITQQQADQLLAVDLMQFERAVKRLVTAPLTRGEFSALVSYAYNCGAGALAGTNMLKQLNKGNYEGAAFEFVNGWEDSIPGLLRRRKAEKYLFETGKFSEG